MVQEQLQLAELSTIKFDNINQHKCILLKDMDRFKEFQESFIAHLQALYKAMQGKSNKELDDALVLQGKSDEQKQIIQETCQDVDKEHDMIEEMVNSNKTPGEFLKQDITDTVKEVNPNATDEDVNQIVEATMDVMEKEIEQQARELTKETTLLTEEPQSKPESEEGK